VLNALKNKLSVVTDLTDIWKPIYLKVDEKLKEFEYEGTTASTVLIWRVGQHRYVQAANVGDSTAFIMYSHTKHTKHTHIFVTYVFCVYMHIHNNTDHNNTDCENVMF
jgi:hypothetical protein